MTALSVIAKLAEHDEGTALFLLRCSLFEALCDEAERVGPVLEQQAAKVIAKQAEGLLEQNRRQYVLAKREGRPVTPHVDAAVQLSKMLEVAKAGGNGDNPQTPWWDSRDANGRFQAGRARQSIIDTMGVATGEDTELRTKAGQAIREMSGQDGRFRQLNTLGRALSGTDSKVAQQVGTVTSIIAEVGPEAQAALEPGARRTAYRYRGTERRPREQLQRSAAASVEASQTDPATGRRKDRPDDKARLQALTDVGVSELWRQVPPIDTARISLEAGKMPPSIGIMFDRDGRPVSEAMGYNGDHYLPFDLKNLKSLQGGSYVRTRTTGGLTDEDIYTGLMTGARQMTVVSNSGVFTLEFDPTLRGGRRYNDKAKQMVDRYASLTGVIDSGRLMQTPISRERRQELISEAKGLVGDDPDAIRAELQRLEERELKMAQFEELDEDVLADEALAELKEAGGTLQGAAFATAHAQLTRKKIAEARQNQAKNFRLDHDGYRAAMKALKTEFPFFIRDARTLPLQEHLASRKLLGPEDPLPKRGGRDIGYTGRNELAPRYNQAGGVRDAKQRLGREDRRPVTPPAREDVDTTSATTPVGQKVTADARQAVSGQLPEPNAPTFEEAAKQAATLMSRKAGNALAGALAMRGDVNLPGQLADVDDDDNILGLEAPGTLNQTPGGYAEWVLHNDPKKFTAFLAKQPADSKHHQKIREALIFLRDKKGVPADIRQAYPKQVFDDALSALDALSGGSQLFAEPAENMAMEPPDTDSPRPQPFPEVTALGASQKNIAAFAQRNKSVARMASLALDDEETFVNDLYSTVDELARLQRWGGEGDPPVGTSPDQREAARRLKENPESSPSFRTLRDMQMGWALARAAQFTQTVTEKPIPDFMALGSDPKAEAPQAGQPAPEVKQRTGKSLEYDRLSRPRIVFHRPDSPVAKAAGARLSRPQLHARPLR